jgi:hypothetical protein
MARLKLTPPNCTVFLNPLHLFGTTANVTALLEQENEFLKQQLAREREFNRELGVPTLTGRKYTLRNF